MVKAFFIWQLVEGSRRLIHTRKHHIYIFWTFVSSNTSSSSSCFFYNTILSINLTDPILQANDTTAPSCRDTCVMGRMVALSSTETY